MPGLDLLVAVVVGYLIGAVPSGVIVGRLRGVDPRSGGSGRTGTTNALRTLGPGLAAAVAVLDVAKGALAVVVGTALGAQMGGVEVWAGMLAGVAAVIGHVRSVFIGFTGGRGVATGGGVMLVLAPLAMVAAVVVMALVVWRTRLVSLGSLLAAGAVTVVAVVLYAAGRVGLEVVVGAALVELVVMVAHADNIQRLRTGTERKIGSG